MRCCVAIMDLQFGSTGKGQIAGTIAKHWKPDTVVTAWGPNAGHTFRDGELQMVSRMVASSAIQPSVENILLGPGSVIDLNILKNELDDRGPKHLAGKNLIIHPQAVILTKDDEHAEQNELRRIGSTMKGTGHALTRKVMRQEEAIVRHNVDWVSSVLCQTLTYCDMSLALSSRHYDWAVDRSRKMMVEGSQGFSLGIHTDFYPYTTGRDISTAQLFADCRLPWPASWSQVDIIGVARTFPIRVANRYIQDASGSRVQVGTSGGCYPDQKELAWEEIGREPELTTVTQLPRRIFSFSKEQVRQAARVCAPRHIALTFCDYQQDMDPAVLNKQVQDITDRPVRFMSFGPDLADVKRVVYPNRDLVPLLSTECDYLGDQYED